MTKQRLRILLIVFFTLSSLIAAFFIAVRFPAFQTYLAHRAAAILSNQLGSKVTVERIEIQFFNKADLINVYIEDHNRDTLIGISELVVSFKVFEFFNKKLEVKKISLKGAELFLHKDSSGVMNLSQLLENFSSAEKKPDTSASAAWSIDLRKFEISKTRFRYLDEKSHTEVNVFVPLCEIDLNKLELSKKLIDLESVKLDGTDVTVDLLRRELTPGDDSVMHVQFMANGFRLKFQEFALTNTRFRLTDHNSDTVLPKGMDFKHLDVSGINLIAETGTIEPDSILANVKQLSAKERSGFELQSLIAQARVSVNDITLDKLSLKTPNSEIKNYLSFRYSAFHDFKNFLDGVSLHAKFNDTRVSLKDLGYFIRNIHKIEHNKLSVTGEITGTVSNLKGKNVEIRTGEATVFSGSFSSRGLPDIYETSLNLRVKRLAATVDDIRRFYPYISYPKNLYNLGLVYYTGSLDGFLTDFVSNGKFVTALGTANTDVNFKYDKKNNKAFYKGLLALNEFDLGKYFDAEKNLGKVSLETKISGGGLTLESLNARLDGNISSIRLFNYDYNNAKIDGSVLKKSFDGSIRIRDAYLDMNFHGIADLTEQVPEFKFDADIQKAFLKNLNLAKDDLRVSGRMISDFKGAKIDDWVGSLKLSDITLARDTIEASIKNFSVNAKLLSAETKEIKLNSDFAEGELAGNFTIKELPRALIAFAKYTFTADYTDTLAAVSPQNFSFDLRIFEPENLTQVIHPRFELIRHSRLQGNFNSIDHQLSLTANIPELKFGEYVLRRTDLRSDFKKGDIDFRTSIDKVYSGDSLLLDTVGVLSRTLENKTVRFDLSVADKQNYNYANLTAFLTPQKNRAVVSIHPSDIKLGNYFWKFNSGNVIFIEGKKVTTNNLVFRTEEQAVYINSYLKNDTSTSIKLTLANTSISDFTGMFATKMKDIQGSINGKLVVEDVFYKPNVFADFVVDEFKLGNELIGDINVESRLDDSGKKILVKSSVRSINNFIEASGYVSLSSDSPSLKINVDASRLGLNFLNYKFFNRYVKDCRGYAVVHATVTGTLKKPLLLGEVDLINDTVTVSFLNTTYRIEKHKALLDERGFNIGDITIYDVRKNAIYGHGRINHESFRKFALDLRVNTENGQFLNTTAKESPNFHGVAYGKGNISFFGDINSPLIRAYALTRPGTYCKLPVNTAYEINRYGFYRFVNPNEKKQTAVTPTPQLKLNGVNFILDLEATPDARMDIILDPVAGDVLTTYGRGNLKIEIPRSGNTTIYGNYEIERGSYLFTLQSLVNKRFEINRGSTINFTGDVYKAGLNVDAVYEVRASVYDLIADLINNSPNAQTESTSQNQILTASRSRIPIRLFMNLTGALERPNITFDIKAIDADPTIKSYVDQKLALLKNNEKDLNNQVFGLLVMNRFLPSQNNFTGNELQGYISGTAANTVSEFLSSQFSNYLNSLIGTSDIKTLRDFEFRFGYRQYDQSTLPNSVDGGSGNQQTIDVRREVQFAIQQRLLNNRITINAGGNLDFGNSTVVDPNGSNNGVQGGSRAVIPTGDFQIQYSLTPDGRWSAKAFNRTNYDYFNSRNTNRTGVGLSYRQEFDRPADLFPKKKTKKKKTGEKQKSKNP